MLGLYLHIPFCIRKCNYCDFCSFPLPSAAFREQYITSLCCEIESYRREPKLRITSVFFGGGTPSLLSASELNPIFDKIHSVFDVADEAEITLESNPKTLTKENLALFRSFGFNRLSIGGQSMQDNELSCLGRIHSAGDLIEAFTMARSAGFDNVNIDLMYGIPEQTADSFADTLHRVIDFSPEHISVYGLMVEEGTPFYDRRENLSLPDEDAEADMYDLACRMLADAGYRHYEISNYALPGRESKHNLTYWKDASYIGVGLAAYSYFEGRRYGNTRDPECYFSGKDFIVSDETLSKDASAFEYAMLALRLADGISLSAYQARFGTDFREGREPILSKMKQAGLMEEKKDSLRLTERGFYVSNAILAELL